MVVEFINAEKAISAIYIAVYSIFLSAAYLYALRACGIRFFGLILPTGLVARVFILHLQAVGVVTFEKAWREFELCDKNIPQKLSFYPRIKFLQIAVGVMMTIIFILALFHSIVFGFVISYR